MNKTCWIAFPVLSLLVGGIWAAGAKLLGLNMLPAFVWGFVLCFVMLVFIRIADWEDRK